MSDSFEVGQIKKWINEQCEKAQSQLASVAPSDVIPSIEMETDPDDDRHVVITFNLVWPKLKDIGMEITELKSQLIGEDFDTLMQIGGEIDVKETLTFTFSPYLKKLQEFMNEHA